MILVQAMQQRLSNQVAKLEVKFSKVQQAHDVLDEGVQKRQTSCARIRADTEQQTNILFNL